MQRFWTILAIVTILVGCGSARRGTDRPAGMTGTSGSGTTTGTGTSAPTGTVGTGATTDPASPGAVIPKEGKSTYDDSAITATVIARLKEAGYDRSIKVETDNGVVKLKGTVPTQEQLEQIVKMLQSLPEVESVITDDLLVR